MNSHPALNREKKAPKTLSDFFAAESEDPIADAFAAKKAVHPFVDMTPVPADQIAGIWGEISHRPRRGKSVVYIHIPFCENHCLFCGFYRNAWRESGGRDYAKALIGDLRRDLDLPYQAEGPIHAVYLGGGTPSALSAIDLRLVLETVHESLPLAPDCEVTVEGRVRSFSPDKVKACIDGGANRFSIGVQSFQTQVRQRMGRKADRAQVLDFLDLLVKTDQAAVVIDLIYGFPGQTIDDFEDDVCTAIATGIDGLDLYSLNLIPGTPLLSVIEKGKSAPPAPVNRLGAYYERGAEVLDGARWDRISTTHWRSSTRERNLYNLLVKKGANCLAYGSGAGGFAGGYSYRIDRDLESYMARADKKQIPLAHLMRQSRHHRVLNQIKGQLETGKLNLGWLADELSACGLAYEDIVAPLVAQWKRAGLLELRGSWADLTLAGRFWQVALAQGLLEWLGQALSAPASADLETL